MKSTARSKTAEARAVVARPRIALTLAGAWFALGCAALLLVPASRGSDPWLGWLPFWLVGVPVIEWTLLRLCCLPASVTAAAVRSRARHVIAARGPSSRRTRNSSRQTGRSVRPRLLTALFVDQI